MALNVFSEKGKFGVCTLAKVRVSVAFNASTADSVPRQLCARAYSCTYRADHSQIFLNA